MKYYIMAMKEAQGCPSGFYYAYLVPDFKGANYKEYYCPGGFGWFVFWLFARLGTRRLAAYSPGDGGARGVR